MIHRTLCALAFSALSLSSLHGQPNWPADLRNKNIVEVACNGNIFPGWACGYLDLYYACELECELGLRQDNDVAAYFNAESADNRQDESCSAHLEQLSNVFELQPLYSLALENGELNLLGNLMVNRRFVVDQSTGKVILDRAESRTTATQRELAQIVRGFKGKTPLAVVHFVCGFDVPDEGPHAILISIIRKARENGKTELRIYDNLRGTNLDSITRLANNAHVQTYVRKLYALFGEAEQPQQIPAVASVPAANVPAPAHANYAGDEDEEFRRAIEASLHTSQPAVVPQQVLVAPADMMSLTDACTMLRKELDEAREKRPRINSGLIYHETELKLKKISHNGFVETIAALEIIEIAITKVMS